MELIILGPEKVLGVVAGVLPSSVELGCAFGCRVGSLLTRVFLLFAFPYKNGR